jgi:hypothetical protein
MRSVQLIARVGVLVLLLCLLIGGLIHLPKSMFFGLASLLLLAAAVDAFILYFRPDLSIIPNSKALAYLVSISPLSNWYRNPGSLLAGGILFGVFAITTFARALGYW